MNLTTESTQINTKHQRNFILIDGSYFCFQRYHALSKWWKLSDKPPCDEPFECEEFVNKFKTTFHTKIKEIKKKLKIKDPTVFVAKDCPRSSIWRHECTNDYKKNRQHNSHIGNFFKMAYDTLFKSAGVTEIFAIDQLEADDCIAITTKLITTQFPDSKIYIIANDTDYLQLVSSNVFVFNMSFKSIATTKTQNNDSSFDLFCKIVRGDKSDNIPPVFSKCSVKTALYLFNNPNDLEEKLQKKNASERMNQNRKLVDFNYIPEHLSLEFQNKYCTFLV